ncbi:MAG: hypothetical protein JSV51_10110 [Candidatus Bathyarchaeota archaeon]|nr:MAG: hypothetical protein JSV51_10110 [Candidatus Bathyarchaeota archaeon]
MRTLKISCVMLGLLFLLLFLRISYSAGQVAVEFLYWDPSTDPKYCDTCPPWIAAYLDFLNKNETIRSVSEHDWEDKVVFEWIDITSATGDEKRQLYNISSQKNSVLVINGQLKIEGAFNETYIVETIEAVLEEVSSVRIPGVLPGDYWIVNTSFTWLTTPYSDSLVDLWSNAEMINTTILNVSDTNVTYSMFIYLANGSDRRYICEVDVATGESNISSFLPPYWIVAANLWVGDSLYTDGSFFNWKINATEMKEYAGQDRQVNIVNITSGSISYLYYYDKLTGIMLDGNATTSDYSAQGVTKEIIPEFPSPLVLPLFMAATLLVVIAYRRKHKPVLRRTI